MLNKTEEEIMSTWDNSKGGVSIRCLAYNHEKYIDKCLEGFLIQITNFPFEIIVHDDASSDNTARIIEIYKNKYPLIVKPIYEKDNLYKNQNDKFNYRINSKLNGKYVAMCEGDDYWTSPHKLQSQYDAMECNNECIIAFNRVEFVDVEGYKTGYVAPPQVDIQKKFILLEDYINSEYRDGNWTFHTSSFFLKTETLKAFFDVRKEAYSIFPYGDMALIVYCLSRGTGILIPEIMGCYRQMSGGYNSYVKKHPEFAISQDRKLINALYYVNNITANKYEKQIDIHVNRAKMNIALLNKEHKVFWKYLTGKEFDFMYCVDNKKRIRRRIYWILRFYFPYVVYLRRKLVKCTRVKNK